MKNPKPDLKSPDSEFFDSVEISTMVEYSTLSEISTKISRFQKSRFWGVFRVILWSRARISGPYWNLGTFRGCRSFLEQIFIGPATPGHYIADMQSQITRGRESIGNFPEGKIFEKFFVHLTEQGLGSPTHFQPTSYLISSRFPVVLNFPEPYF